MLRDELLEAARERARGRGRGLAIADVLDVAMDRSSRLLVHGPVEPIRRLLVPGPDEPEATEDEIGALFQRASALAVGLDQPVDEDHVAVVATLHPHVGNAGAGGMIRHMILHELVGPSTSEMAHLAEQLDGEPGRRETVALASGWHIATEGEIGHGATGPRCRGCGSDLDGRLRHTTVKTDSGGTVELLICARCGATQ